jgi:cell division septum initiation protein DivIVA
MLTPVDVQNKVFKGGIGFDKKDVETFMKDLSSDYEQLYRSNVELKDKVATLTESLQHYRSTEDSMQKALTLSEKTAEETIIAANDKARQINNEATKKAESILADAKQELIETKDEIHRLQQLHAKFKAQYTKILQGQLQLIENKVVDIDLGEGYEMGNFEDFGHGFGEGGLGGGGLGGGLGSLGEGGGYTGASSFDDRFERTNQEPAFNHSSLNTDPFSDAANGGGRFSKQTGKGFTGSSSNKKKSSSSENKSSLNMKGATAGSNKAKHNYNTTSSGTSTEPARDTVARSTQKPSATQHNAQGTASGGMNNGAATSSTIRMNSAPNAASTSKVHREQTTASTGSMNSARTTASASSVNNTQGATFVSGTQSTYNTASTAAPAQEAPRATEGTSFQTASSTSFTSSNATESATLHMAGSSSTAEQTHTTAQFHTNTMKQETAVSGEVEEKIDESTLIGNDDDDSEGFNFMDEGSTESEAFYNGGVVSGEVEEKIDESTLIGNDDDDSEGFNFMDDSAEPDSFYDEGVVSGEVEEKIDESTLIGNDDDDDEGFNFMDDAGDFTTEQTSAYGSTDSFYSESSYADTSYTDTDEDTYSGEVEDKVNESTMLESEDNFDEGFNFVVGNDGEEEIPTISSDGASLNIDLDSFSRNPEPEEDVFVGDVEENVNQSNLIGNADDDSEGFNFL